MRSFSSSLTLPLPHPHLPTTFPSLMLLLSMELLRLLRMITMMMLLLVVLLLLSLFLLSFSLLLPFLLLLLLLFLHLSLHLPGALLHPLLRRRVDRKWRGFEHRRRRKKSQIFVNQNRIPFFRFCIRKRRRRNFDERKKSRFGID